MGIRRRTLAAAGPAIAGMLLLGTALLSAGAAAEGAGEPPAERGMAGTGDTVAARSIIVKYEASASAAAIRKLEKELGITSKRHGRFSGMTVVTLPDSANLADGVTTLLASGIVEEAGLNLPVKAFDVPNDPGYARQWHLQNTAGGVRAEAAWNYAAGQGSGVVVAVIDTGAAYEPYSRPGVFGTATFGPAPDLAGVPIVAPWNFLDNSTHANDDQGHGTHVAGTILQATNNGIGVAGVAGGASLMPLKILDYSGQGQASDLIEAIYYAVDHGARVINLSLGFSSTGTPNASGEVCTEITGLAGALDYADAHGVTVVAATGNDGAATVSCPAAYPTVIAVGATRYDTGSTFYSNSGSTIDVAAPGGDPNVDQNGDGFGDGVLQQTYCLDPFYLLVTGSYTQFCDVYYSGTSMATPHVSGIAALLAGESPGLSPAQIRHYLETTARDGGAPGWDEHFGAGIVDAAGALALLKGAPPPVFTPTPTPSVSPTATPTSTPTPTPIPAPASPTSLTLAVQGADSIALTWADNSTNEQYFRVERSTDGAIFTQVALLGANSTGWTNSLLTPSTTYFFRVRASAGTAYSGYSNVASATTAPPPAAPTDLVISGTTADSVRLAWIDNSSDEQYFRIERSSDGVSFAQLGLVTANTTSWTNSSLAPSTTYFYRVRASAGSAYSGYSNVAIAATNAPPTAPGGLAAAPLSADSIKLTWTDNSGDEQYFRIERSTDGAGFTQVGLVSANTTSWTNWSLTPSTTYFYRVRASAGTAYSTYSNVASTTTNAPPAAPTGLAAAPTSADSVKLTWTDNSSDEQYFRVERSADGISFTQVGFVSANTTAWTNSSLTPSTTYFYRVRASAGSIYSGYSNVASATTKAPPAAPTGLSLSVLAPDSIRLSWTDNATDEQYYRVERSTDGASFTQVGLLGANSSSWTNSSLSPSTTYFYRVRASAGTAYSGYSNTAGATTASPPEAPSGLTASLSTATSVTLAWIDNSSTEQYFRVERSTDGVNFTQVALRPANTTSWTNSSLSGNTTYWYRVRASVGSVYSAYSNVVQVTTGAP